MWPICSIIHVYSYLGGVDILGTCDSPGYIRCLYVLYDRLLRSNAYIHKPIFMFDDRQVY
jgi:hypothetical protein